MKSLEDFEKTIGYSFKAKKLLKIAKNITETPTNEWGGLTFLSQKKRA